MAEQDFLSGLSNEHQSLSVSEIMLHYKTQLDELSDFLQFGVDYGDISIANIDGWIQELRDILKGMKDLQDNPNVDRPVIPYGGVRGSLLKAIIKLCLSLDILKMRGNSLKYREKFYQNFIDCSMLLSNVVEAYFKFEDFSE